MKLRFGLLLCAVAFAVTLAVVVGQRLSTEAMAVVVGVVAGVAASIPTALIVVWVASRVSAAGPRGAASPGRESEHPPEPRIIVVPSSAPYPVSPPYLSFTTPPPDYTPPTAPRRYKMIGGEDEQDQEGE
jgi:hypothetical protein